MSKISMESTSIQYSQRLLAFGHVAVYPKTHLK